MDKDNKKVEYTHHLLDIEKFNGKFEGRSSNAIIFIIFMGAPLLMFWGVVFQLFLKYGVGIMLLIVLPPYIIYGFVVAAYVLGGQAKRVKQYKRRQEKKYDDISEVIHIKNIRPDGCVEYFNGSIAYMIAAYNGNVATTSKFIQIRDFLSSVNPVYTLNILVQNLNDTEQLDAYMSNIGQFTDKDVARDYLKILDKAREDVESSSLVVRIVYSFHARATERVLLKRALDSVLPKKAYFEVHIAERAEVLNILGKEIGTTVNIESMISKRFAKGRYFRSHVVAYNIEDEPKSFSARHRNGKAVTGFLQKKGV